MTQDRADEIVRKVFYAQIGIASKIVTDSGEAFHVGRMVGQMQKQLEIELSKEVSNEVCEAERFNEVKHG